MLCNTGSQQASVIAIIPMEICSSYSCAESQQKCNAALVWAKCIPHCSVMLCNTGSQQVSVSANTSMEICCSYMCAVSQRKMQCSTGLGKMHFPLFSDALQHRLTAGFCHCNNTYGDLLFVQVCSEPTKMQCSAGLSKMHSPLFSDALQNRLAAGFCHCNCIYGDLLVIHVCSEPTKNALQHWSGQHAFSTVQ